MGRKYCQTIIIIKKKYTKYTITHTLCGNIEYSKQKTKKKTGNKMKQRKRKM